MKKVFLLIALAAIIAGGAFGQTAAQKTATENLIKDLSTVADIAEYAAALGKMNDAIKAMPSAAKNALGVADQVNNLYIIYKGAVDYKNASGTTAKANVAANLAKTSYSKVIAPFVKKMAKTAPQLYLVNVTVETGLEVYKAGLNLVNKRLKQLGQLEWDMYGDRFDGRSYTNDDRKLAQYLVVYSNISCFEAQGIIDNKKKIDDLAAKRR